MLSFETRKETMRGGKRSLGGVGKQWGTCDMNVARWLQRNGRAQGREIQGDEAKWEKE